MTGIVCPNCTMTAVCGRPGQLLSFRHTCPDGTKVIHGPDKELAAFLEVPGDSVVMIRKEPVSL